MSKARNYSKSLDCCSVWRKSIQNSAHAKWNFLPSDKSIQMSRRVSWTFIFVGPERLRKRGWRVDLKWTGGRRSGGRTESDLLHTPLIMMHSHFLYVHHSDNTLSLEWLFFLVFFFCFCFFDSIIFIYWQV